MKDRISPPGGRGPQPSRSPKGKNMSEQDKLFQKIMIAGVKSMPKNHVPSAWARSVAEYARYAVIEFCKAKGQ